MMALTFDTLEFVKELRQSGFNEEQAEGLSSAIKKTYESQLEGLATKHDLKEIESKFDNRLDQLESKFDNRLDQLESKFDNRLNQLESKIDGELKLIKWGLALVIAVTVLPVLKEIFS